MSDRLNHLEKAVAELNPAELKQFASWFNDFEHEAWEKQTSPDAKAGRLDFLIKEAREETKAAKLERF